MEHKYELINNGVVDAVIYLPKRPRDGMIVKHNGAIWKVWAYRMINGMGFAKCELTEYVDMTGAEE
jgi:hypothetical protein